MKISYMASTLLRCEQLGQKFVDKHILHTRNLNFIIFLINCPYNNLNANPNQSFKRAPNVITDFVFCFVNCNRPMLWQY